MKIDKKITYIYKIKLNFNTNAGVTGVVEYGATGVIKASVSRVEMRGYIISSHTHTNKKKKKT